MSSHSEKLLEVELELRSLRLLRDEVETLRGTLENVRTRLNALEQGGRSGTGSTTHTLGQNIHSGLVAQVWGLVEVTRRQVVEV